MPKINLPIINIIRTLESGSFLTEALFFPEALRFNSNKTKAIESLHANVNKVIDELSPAIIHQRVPAGEPQIIRRSFTITPPHESVKSGAWRKPVTLEFDVIHWSHGEVAHIAYIPALGIEVVSTKPPALQAIEKRLPQEVSDALGRVDALNSLGPLFWMQRTVETRIERSSIEAETLTPKQIEVKELEREDRKASALAETSTDLTKENLPAAFEMDDVVAQLAEALTGRSPRSVLLVGGSGVGKTAAVYELARRRQDFQLGHTPFRSTNGSRLIAGMSGFGQWQDRCQKLWREAAQERAILYLGNLIELMEVGRYSGNSIGIAGFLRPYIARGDVLAIAECTPEQLSLIEREDPRLLEAFHQIRIPEPSIEKGKNILLSYAMTGANSIEIELDAIERIDQLHRRYASYSAYPGRPIRFLKNLLQDYSGGKVHGGSLTVDDVNEAFSRESGLPPVLLDEREKLDLDATRGWFASRVIGQPETVDLVVDLLATIKAGLTRPRKPIASLLFIGPTGVGKTEMAKSLAEFLFQNRQRLVRFDMSEYATPSAVGRLIGDSFGGEGSLTSKVREQPFAVVLFDEFEKAHPLFFDLLLQTLGEGRLTDGAGRVSDFSNTVVILTSNLGAESFQRGQIGLTGLGQSESTREAAKKHFTRALRRSLRPELFNRIDRIVPFTPLDEGSVLRIAEREIERIKERDGIRFRNITLSVDGEAIKYFALRGYDPRYGARPLKRVIERELLAPLAEKFNQTRSDDQIKVLVSLENSKLLIDMQIAPKGKARDENAAYDRELWTSTFIHNVSHFRRETRRLAKSSCARNLQNEIYNIQRIEKRLRQSKWKSPADLALAAALPRLKNAWNWIESFIEKVQSFERELMLVFYNKSKIDRDAQIQKRDQYFKEWNELLLSLYTLHLNKLDYISFAIFCEESDQLYQSAGVYYDFAKSRGAVIEAVQFTALRKPRGRQNQKEREKDASGADAGGENTPIRRAEIKNIEEFLSEHRPEIRGIGFGMSFPLAFPTLELEKGLHAFTRNKKTVKWLVDVSEASLAHYRPPEGIELHGAIGSQPKRRSINFDQTAIEDGELGRLILNVSQSPSNLIASLIERSLQNRIRSVLSE